MPSLSSQDRLPLCRFTFADGRRCRTPRVSTDPNFCFYHSQKEAQAVVAAKLANDLSFFFSSDYISACDLSSALVQLIPAVIQGHLKPRPARTVAFLFQMLLQSVRLAQHEYINTFGTDSWTDTIADSVKLNHQRRFPPKPKPAPPSSGPQSTPPPSAPPASPVSSPPDAAPAPHAASGTDNPKRNEGSSLGAHSGASQPATPQPVTAAPPSSTPQPGAVAPPRSTLQPTAPSAPPPRSGAPGFAGNTDPYAIRLDASLVRIDGKPI